MPGPFDKDEFEDEPPTKSEGVRTECPRCTGEDGRPTGRILVTVWDSSGAAHRSVCPLCGGRRLVGHTTLERFKAAATEPPPPFKGEKK